VLPNRDLAIESFRATLHLSDQASSGAVEEEVGGGEEGRKQRHCPPGLGIVAQWQRQQHPVEDSQAHQEEPTVPRNFREPPQAVWLQGHRGRLAFHLADPMRVSPIGQGHDSELSGSKLQRFLPGEGVVGRPNRFDE
jgi:hypothetical protein